MCHCLYVCVCVCARICGDDVHVCHCVCACLWGQCVCMCVTVCVCVCVCGDDVCHCVCACLWGRCACVSLCVCVWGGDDVCALHVFFLFQSAVYVAVCMPVHWWVHVYVLFMWIGLGGCLCQPFRKFVEVL